MARKLEVQIVGDASSLERAFGRAGNAGNSFSHGLGKVGKAAAFAIGGAGLAGIAGVAAVLKVGVPEWEKSTKVAAQTGAVIKSTGGVANISAAQVDALSTSLMNKSGVDDEAIKSGENMLLTFKDIRNEAGRGNDIFTQTTKATLDMSVAMGEDMSKSAIRVGKALNDPIKGVTALSKVGVTFTDGQRKTIKSLVESGHAMEAQKIILKELNSEFGGSAAAIGATLPGKIDILKQQFSNLAGSLVESLVPSMTRLLTWTTTNWPRIEETFRTVFAGIGFAITNILAPALNLAVQVGQRAVAWFKANWPQIRAVALAAMEPVVAWVRANWPQIQLVITNVVQSIRTVVTTTLTVLQAVWARFGDTITSVTRTTFNTIRTVIEGVMNVIKGIVNIVGGLIRGDWQRVWQGVQQIVTGVTGVIKGLVSGAFNALAAIIRGVGGAILAAARSVAEAALHGITSGLAQLPALVGTLFGMAATAISGLAGQFFSAAFAIGKAIVTGVIAGIGDIATAVGHKIASGISAGIGWAKGNIGSTADEATEEHLGKPLAEGVIRGWILGTETLPAKMADTVRNAIEAARAVVADARSRFSDAWGGMVNDALAAFDALKAGIRTRSEKLIDVEEARRQMAALKRAVAEGNQAVTDAKKGVTDAKTSLTAAQATGDPEQIAQAQAALKQASDQLAAAQQQLDDALWEQRKARLEKQAAEERKQLDAKVALQRRHLEEQLAALEKRLEKQGASAAATQKGILGLLGKYGVDYKSSGLALGKAFAQGMRESVGDVEAAANALADAARKRLKLNSPAEEGPMSDLDSWWKKLPQTLVGGMNTGAVGTASSGLAAAGMGAFAGGGGNTYITVSAPGYLGDKAELGRVIVAEVKRANRAGSLRASDLP